jgi:hypothetical protein
MTNAKNKTLKQKQIERNLALYQKDYPMSSGLIIDNRVFIEFTTTKPAWAKNIMEVFPNSLRSISNKERKAFFA